MLLRSILTLLLLLNIAAAAAVFVSRDEAHGVLRRWRRANTGFLEELKKGNLERECIEEICNYEEAREVFEDDDQTRQFWSTYGRRDPCLVNPCRNNGTCIYAQETYECQCPEGFEGRYCQTVFEDSLKCLYLNGLCQHFCDGSGEKRKCSCADGYKLGEDGRECVADVQFPCGQTVSQVQDSDSTMTQTRMVGSNLCPQGLCPWQVLIQLNGTSHCGGVAIAPEWVLTAAHCAMGHHPHQMTVVAGEQNLDADDGTEQRSAVTMAIVHPSYVMSSGQQDLALLRLNSSLVWTPDVVPVCMPTQDLWERELSLVRYHTVSGWGKRTRGGNVVPSAEGKPTSSSLLRRMMVPIIENSRCSQVGNFNFTRDMICAGYLEGRQESCRGDDGSPLVTVYGHTHFVTGVAAWGRGCSQPGYYGVYTKVANFVEWVEQTMKAPPTTMSTVKAAPTKMTPSDVLQQKLV